ncbi:MAG: hypothetical protein ABSG36_03335 [Acidimicrobiales bacterium]|jgi:hypothetical protein
MIVRILGEGQFELDESQVGALEDLDKQLLVALEAGDEASFHAVLGQLVKKVRADGKPVAPDRFVPSDLALPHESASLEELREFLASEDAGES